MAMAYLDNGQVNRFFVVFAACKPITKDSQQSHKYVFILLEVLDLYAIV